MSRDVEDDRNWREQAACAGIEAGVFYPTRGEETSVAIAICDTCEVSRPCLRWALKHERFGIWGGTNGRQRERIRKAQHIKLVILETEVLDQLDVIARRRAERRDRNAAESAESADEGAA